MTKKQINRPYKSKIVWTSLAIAIIGVLVAYDVVPAQAQEPLTDIVMIVGPVLVATFRIWFTAPKDAADG